MNHSTTIVLPKWFATLDKLEVRSCMMPCDVSTQWNSTYDMLKFAVTYREALDIITGDQEMKLRQYEMDEEEWSISWELCKALKVPFHPIYCICRSALRLPTRCSKMQHSSFHEGLQILQQSSQPWTALVRSLQQVLLTLSSPPSSQASVFQEHWLGWYTHHDCREYCPGKVWGYVQVLTRCRCSVYFQS